jgi:hypothetical protein
VRLGELALAALAVLALATGCEGANEVTRPDPGCQSADDNFEEKNGPCEPCTKNKPCIPD